MINGIPTLLSTHTASGATNLSITSNIDSTYDVYMFVFTAIHPSADRPAFTFNGSTDGGSSYAVTKTTTFFKAKTADGTTGDLSYMPDDDLAQSTDYQTISDKILNDAEASTAGILYLFGPSSTTYVKNFNSRSNCFGEGDRTQDMFLGGYFNTTSAINAVDFKISTGTFDGVIQMYGIG